MLSRTLGSGRSRVENRSQVASRVYSPTEEAQLAETVQIVGPRYREDLCLDATQALEERLGVATPLDPRPAGTR